MKCPKPIALLIILTVCVSSAFSQKADKDKIVAPKQLMAEKPRLFDQLPEKFNVYRTVLDQLFTTDKNTFSLPIKTGLALEGEILEKVQQNPHVVSINIRLKNFNNSLLHISRIIENDLSVSYNARVINIKNGDVLVLKQENNQFYFTREKQSLIAVE